LGSEKQAKAAEPKEPSPVRPYHSGIAQSRLIRGATFAAKAGRTPPPPIRRQIRTRKNADSVSQTQPPLEISGTASAAKMVDFGALAAKAAASRVSPQKEALLAALLSEGRTFRAISQDIEAFDNGMSVVADTLPDVIDE
jgi:type IV secretion system protein VirD4